MCLFSLHFSGSCRWESAKEGLWAWGFVHPSKNGAKPTVTVRCRWFDVVNSSALVIWAVGGGSGFLHMLSSNDRRARDLESITHSSPPSSSCLLLSKRQNSTLRLSGSLEPVLLLQLSSALSAKGKEKQKWIGKYAGLLRTQIATYERFEWRVHKGDALANALFILCLKHFSPHCHKLLPAHVISGL